MRIIAALGLAIVVNVGPALASSSVDALESYKLITLTSAHFASGNLDLTAGDRASLDGLARHVCQTNQTVIELRGYADGAGSAAKDVALSAERAEAIKKFLIERGVPTERIVAIGLGEIDPAGPALRPEHQRVDIRVFIQ
jgi:OOP family OmpA-OmpF porin